ncbi:MAG: porin [Muribaculaceae bacterium]|nr:porin [Muribaculaceae bacterium]
MSGYAQGGNSLTFDRTSKADSLILDEARSKSPHEIPVPKFVLKSANNKFLMTIGGKVSAIMGWDIGNNLYNQDGAGISFTTQKIPVPATEGHRSDFFINPLNSAIDFQVVGLTDTPDQITGYVKIAANKSNGSLKLSRAYISWRGLTVGKKLTLFEDDNAAQPTTIDPEGPSGTVSTSVYEIGYKSKDYNGLKFAVGIDMPTWYASDGVYRGKDYPVFDGKQVADYGDAEQVLPDVPAWVEYSAPSGNRVRVSALLRNFAYRDLLAMTTRHMAGWGMMLSGNLKPSARTLVYYQLAYGKGIGAYLQDIAGMPLSFVPENSKPGRMTASPMAGINLGLTYNINSKWQANVMASESRIWDVEDYAIAESGSNYKYALYAAGNVFYNITPYLQWGMEYVWGHRQTWNIGGAHDSRIQTQLKFTF